MLRMITVVGVGILILSYFLYSPAEDDEEFEKYFSDPSKRQMMSNLTAVVLGGTGNAGKGIVKALARAPEYSKVTLIAEKSGSSNIL